MSVPLSVGQVESIRWVLSQEDFDRFAALSGDDNPIHTDPGFSARTRFGRTVAHGMLLYGIVCSVLGSRMPGPGTVQLEQELMFPSPTYAGEEITIQLEVTEVQPAKGLADLTTTVVRPDGNVGLQGRTLVHLPGTTLLPHTFSCSPTLPHPHTPSHSPSSTSSFKGLEIGQQAEISRAFTAQDLAEYAALTGDVNPIFTDAGHARRLGLMGPMIPGSLLGGLFSTLLGTQLPGQGTNYLKQRLEFPAPAYSGQELTAAVKIMRIRPEKQLVNLSTLCTKPTGEVVCRGEALVLVSDVKREA
jgi:acyl dehydratase